MLNSKFLLTIQKSLKIFLTTHPRSNQKLKSLHGNIKRDILQLMNREGIETDSINLISLDENSSSEDIIKGRYYYKAVDISIRKNNNPIGAIGVKFVMNNYLQNANNYFENMLGETANIRTANIPYFQILILFEKMPYFQNGGRLSKWEYLSEQTYLKKYIKLSEDDIEKYYHTPILTLLIVVTLPKEITEDRTIQDKATFNSQLLQMVDSNRAVLKYSSNFSPSIFHDRVIFNDYKAFLESVIFYFLYRRKFHIIN
ncbi:MAG TPA: hypothetical protein EYG60_04900 [Campylobacterales bacterium]|nr:hypothetical protein [Campylobacterales bacterium]